MGLEVAGRSTHSGQVRARMYGDAGTRETDWYECIPFLFCAPRRLCPCKVFRYLTLCTFSK